MEVKADVYDLADQDGRRFIAEVNYNPHAFLTNKNLMKSIADCINERIIDKIVDDLFYEYKKSGQRDKYMRLFLRKGMLKKQSRMIARS